jgi:tRNA(fMet)-specific endonuclease VapC
VTTVLDDTERTAVEHARLLAHVRRAGRARGAHDLIIAAHTAEHGRGVVSLDARARFDGLPGVEAVPA